MNCLLETTMATTNNKNFKSPPVMRDGLTYKEWKADVEIWSDFTELTVEKQGGAVFLTLVGKAQQAVRATVTRAQMKSPTGLKEVLTCLNGLYEKDAARSSFAAYEEFSEYRRAANIPIEDYLIEFNIKYSKLKDYKMDLPDGVLAFYVLKCANLSDDQANLCKATIDKPTYADMRKQIEKVTSNAGRSDKSGLSSQHVTVNSQFYGQEGDTNDGYFGEEEYYEDYDCGGADEVTEETAPCETYYARPQYSYRARGLRRGGAGPPRTPQSSSGLRLNMPDEFGNPTRCSFCRSTYHYVGQCPDAAKQTATRGRGGVSSWRAGGRGRGMHGGRGGANYI